MIKLKKEKLVNMLQIDYSCITFAEFLFCTPIPETLLISLKAAKEIRNIFVFRKLIRTFSIQKKLRTGYAQKYFDKTRKISHRSSFSQTQMNAQRLREHAQMYLNCSLCRVATLKLHSSFPVNIQDPAAHLS